MQKTNEQLFKALFKDLDSIEFALLRERILCIMDLTIKDIQSNPDHWDRFIVDPRLYENLANKINKHLKID